jgi:DNA (cytosine-5)-methyltransferase 1
MPRKFIQIGDSPTTPRSARTKPADFPFTFADLLCGIGGMRLGLQMAGGRNVFSCERDTHACKTYKAWFGDTPSGDIWDINPHEIPDHDILAAGFACQPFSIAGIPKKNSLGQPHGFDDKQQGTLFFRLAEIIAVKRPLAIILENVKNLLSHNKGETYKTMVYTLQGMDYTVFSQVIDAQDYVPQHRERVFIVCFDSRVFRDAVSFSFPERPKERPKMSDILEDDVADKYTLSDALWKYLQAHAARQKAKGNEFKYGIADPNGISRTLSARYYKDGAEILIAQEGKNPRCLTPRECARLMGFPDDLPIVVSNDQACKQFGNALVPRIAADVAKSVVAVFRRRIGIHGLTGFAKMVVRGHRMRNKTLAEPTERGWDLFDMNR